jgi:polyisoprenoid-binding protein YceI
MRQGWERHSLTSGAGDHAGMNEIRKDADNSKGGIYIYMKTAKHVTGLLLATLLLISGISIHAIAEQQFPVPLDGKVSHPVIATMLAASIAGRFYQVQPATSKVWFNVDSIGKQVTGKFAHFKGGVALQPNADNNGDAIFTIKTGSVSTSNFLIDEVICSKSFFDVEQYPEILFVSTIFSWSSETRGVLKGKLTLHGVTKSVEFNVNLSEPNAL